MDDSSCSAKQESLISEIPTIEELCARVEQLEMQLEISQFGLSRFCGSDDDIYFYTGLPNNRILMVFWRYVQPCAESSLTWKHARTKADEQVGRCFPYLHDEDRERLKSRDIQPIGQLWMFLRKVRLGLFERDLAFGF